MRADNVLSLCAGVEFMARSNEKGKVEPVRSSRVCPESY
jgi:hypothetical protein